MNNLNQCILIGGGASFKEGISLGLWEKLNNKFSIGLNYSYKFFSSTINTYVDSTFYNINLEDIKKLPLVIGQGRNLKNKFPNTIIIPSNSVYNRDLRGGCYSAKLCGIYTLSLAIFLLDIGEIFLCGYDNGAITKDLDAKKLRITHWYQNEFVHRGTGKVSYYDAKDRGEKDFGCFKNETKIKIWNVSPLSKINVFEKIDYPTFLQKINPEILNQEELREYVKLRLKGKYT